MSDKQRKEYEKRTRREIYRLFRRHWYWPITQTDARPVLSGPANGALFALRTAIENSAPHLMGRWHALNTALRASINLPEIGRPDILVMDPNNRPGLVCEVKVMETVKKYDGVWDRQQFSLDSIREEQARWMTNWDNDVYTRGVDMVLQNQIVWGAWICLGTSLGTAGAKDRPRMMWLIPWRDWYNKVDQVLRPHSKTLHLVNRARQPKAVQELGLNAIDMLAPYSLQWTGKQDREWWPDESHPFYQPLRARNIHDT